MNPGLRMIVETTTVPTSYRETGDETVHRVLIGDEHFTEEIVRPLEVNKLSRSTGRLLSAIAYSWDELSASLCVACVRDRSLARGTSLIVAVINIV